MSLKHRVSRRGLLKNGGVVGGGALLGPGAIATLLRQAEAASAVMPRRTLGKTGEKIPILLQGGSMSWNTAFDPKLAEALRYGIDYFDAAYSYAGGNNEKAIGSFLTRMNARKKVWLTSKSDQHSPDGFKMRLDESLARMKTDHVDMYFLHDLKDAGKLDKAMMETVEACKKQKKMRFFGFSAHQGNVAELIEAAAKTPWVDAVMFRYNFRQYGNLELNKAMDAAKKANVGLIAMKTQGSSVSFEAGWQKFEQTGKWNKFQAVLKAVWADERISAAVSDMDTIDKIKENAAAAMDKTTLGLRDSEELHRYAHATRSMTCDGCDHICGRAMDQPLPIGPTLRYLMYHDSYGKTDDARRLFRALPEDARRRLAHADLGPAAAACPHGVEIGRHVKRALTVLT